MFGGGQAPFTVIYLAAPFVAFVTIQVSSYPYEGVLLFPQIKPVATSVSPAKQRLTSMSATEKSGRKEQANKNNEKNLDIVKD